MGRVKFWERTINELVNIHGTNGGNPRRIVLNDFTYKLISQEFNRNEVIQANYKMIMGLEVFIDRDYKNPKKIVIEIDDGF